MAKKHIDRAALIATIRELKELSKEQKSEILQLISEQKKYGIVWEDSPEEVEEKLRSEIPVLVEDKSRFIDSDAVDAPNHILIEGDNLEALTALSYTHEGKIDVIYIDPPYNTGNKDFVYNDSFVDSEDGYRHSKWLSFMEKRLRIAKKLMSESSVIFMSIDENEAANLKLLCDEIFGSKNFMGNIIWQSRTSISNDDFISTNHNQTLIYAKSLDLVIFDGENIPASDYINPDNDPRGPWKLVPIDANHPGGDTVFGIVNPKTGVEYYPPKNRIWAFNREGIKKFMDDGRIKFGINDDSSPKKKLYYQERIERGDTKTPSSILLNAKTTKDGTNELIDILGAKKFDYPKPVEFIHRLLMYASKRKKRSIILDFFAGSGTTLHATMLLNAEDGGHRQCILCTNNENNICEEVTYERNKRVINGYIPPKGVEVEGLHNNKLRYYKIQHTERESTATNREKLLRMATDMLCIKENLYNEEWQFGSLNFKKSIVRYFADTDKQMLVVYDPRAIEYIVKELHNDSSLATKKRPLKMYVYSDGAYAYNDEFEGLLDRVELTAMPDALCQALHNILPEPLINETEKGEFEND